MKQPEIGIGGWVRTDKAEIWQIYRVLKDIKCLDPASGAEARQTIVFVKRFVSDSYRKSFTEACCPPSELYPLRQKELRELDKFIRDNAGIYSQFQEYVPKPLHSIYNARITIPANMTAQQVHQRLATDRKFDETQIYPFLVEHGFSTDEYPQWTVQFVSFDHECENGALQYKFDRVLTS